MQRRDFIASTIAATALGVSAQAADAPKPIINRIRIVTTAGPDVKTIESWYTGHLGYKTRESGKVSAEMAKSWGAPKAAGRDYVLMSSDGSPDVYMRAVATDTPAGYAPMTTWGWNSWEIIIDKIDEVFAKMKASPFKIIGEPRPLGGNYPTIHAMQVIGPANEVLYLTTETGDRAKSNLPQAKSLIDRPFIIILASHDVAAMTDFYKANFQVGGGYRFDGPLGLASTAQGLPPDTKYELGLVRLANKGNSIELDGYPKTIPRRPHAEGQLPPGNAMASFNVKRLDGLKVKWITPPAKLYDGKLAASFIGPAGEITEIIEEQPR